MVGDSKTGYGVYQHWVDDAAFKDVIYDAVEAATTSSFGNPGIRSLLIVIMIGSAEEDGFPFIG
jgi:hypothetical protein